MNPAPWGQALWERGFLAFNTLTGEEHSRLAAYPTGVTFSKVLMLTSRLSAWEDLY